MCRRLKSSQFLIGFGTIILTIVIFFAQGGFVNMNPLYIVGIVIGLGFILWGLLKNPESTIVTIAQGITQNADMRRVKREALAEFLDEGQSLKRQCANERESQPEDEANEWAQRTEDYLEREFDKSYISRFRSSAGVPPTMNSISSVPHRNLWACIHTRLYQLEKFIEQLGD